MGVMPLIEKLKEEKLKDNPDLDSYEEPTDSDDEWFPAEAKEKRVEELQKKLKRHEELLKNFAMAETLNDAFKLMNKIDKFEEKHLKLCPEYRVIGDLMNRLKVAEGKEKFILQQKLNRAMRLVKWKETYDPNNPANYGVIQHEQIDPSVDLEEQAGFEKEKKMIRGDDDNEDDEEFDDMKEKDDILLERLNAIDKKLEEKLAELDHTFGKKGKLLEEEIRDLAEERNALTEKKKKTSLQKGF